jgi:ornithine cyclodeaminase/alanine dehydrogenase-like protein (mu-crystallin family)
MRIIEREEVRERLTYDVCIPLVRAAMIAFSKGETRQHLRSILPLGPQGVFGIMPGAVGEGDVFGAKLISVYPGNFAKGLQSHQGVVVLFDGPSGAPVCIAHAGEITAIRTAAASAVATDALARPEAHRLAILGYGEQALTHARAIPHVRPISAVTVWGRDPARAQAFADQVAAELGLPVTACRDVRSAVAEADVVCTVTNAREPIVQGDWLAPGTHLNLVGSSGPGPVEVDHEVVVRSRFIADSREGVLAQGAEFLNAKAAGRIGDDHVVGEIGQVLAGDLEGRQSPEQITVYKSLGHVVQDLAAAKALYEAA